MQQVRVYTTLVCTYCQAAKRLLSQRKIPFQEISLDDKPDLRMQLSAENNGYRTVPMIFIGANFIGGYNELNALDRNGSLMQMVQPNASETP
jgi:glutaredoxin 3